MCAGKKKCNECEQKQTHNNCGGCQGVDGFGDPNPFQNFTNYNNAFGDGFKKAVDKFTTWKNNTIQNVTTVKNDAIQNVKEKGVLRSSFGAAKTVLFGSGSQAPAAEQSFEVPTSGSANYTAPPSNGLGTGGVVAIVAGALVLTAGVILTVKLIRKNKANA